MLKDCNHNIYIGKDGRVRVYIPDNKKVISFPRFLMEEKLGRSLLPNEQVHHIDGNPLNNDIGNLEIKLLGDHQREHNPGKYHDKVIPCAWCGKPFIWTARQQRTARANEGRKIKRSRLTDGHFCSKKCSGIYGSIVQAINKI